MDYVYVVTVSARGSDQGEFAGEKASAFEELRTAQLAAQLCRETVGGKFWAIDASDAEEHILQRWDSDEFTVWLERLLFVAAQ